MYKSFIGAMYVLNIVFQAIFTLLMPIGLGLLCAWLLAEHAGVGGWIWAVLVTIGAILGLISMIRFVLVASAGYERLEKEQNSSKKSEKNVNNRNGNNI